MVNFYNETFSISYWYLLEQIRKLKWGVGAIIKNHMFPTWPPTYAFYESKTSRSNLI